MYGVRHVWAIIYFLQINKYASSIIMMNQNYIILVSWSYRADDIVDW